jgi:hypothetical protein
MLQQVDVGQQSIGSYAGRALGTRGVAQLRELAGAGSQATVEVLIGPVSRAWPCRSWGVTRLVYCDQIVRAALEVGGVAPVPSSSHALATWS